MQAEEEQARGGVVVAAAGALGPVALGAVIGGQIGPTEALRDAALVPAIIAGLTASTVPALYIATAITGSPLSAGGLARAVGRGLEALGVVLLGLIGPLAFVLATSSADWMALLLGGAALGAATVLGMRRMRAAMTVDGGGHVVDGILFAIWAGVALIVGARLFVEIVL